MRRAAAVAGGLVVVAVVAVTVVVVAGGGVGGDAEEARTSEQPTMAPSPTTPADEQLERFAATPMCDDDPAPFDPGPGKVLLGAFVADGDCLTTYYEAVPAGEATDRLAELQADDSTVSAMVDQPAFTSSVAAVDHTGDQWALPHLGLREAWRWTQGNGVRVGVIDTAADASHEDLAANVVVDRAHGRPPGGHGTHVAGIVAAAANDVGVTGVAPEAELITIAGLLPDLPTVVAGAAGIRRAVDAGAKVINLSWFAAQRDGYWYGPLETTLRYAAQRDVVVVMAAGNCGEAEPPTPQCPQGMATVYTPQRWVYDDEPWTSGMLVVGSTTAEGRLSGFSSYAREPSLAAPGSRIWSTIPGNAYESRDGTSMAAPAVSGVAALVRSARPNLTASDVAELLVSTAAPLDDVVPGSAGAGLVDPVAALGAVAGPPPVTDAYLRSMTLPGHVCEYLGLPDETRRLVDGEWHGNALDGPEVSIFVSSAATGDLDGDGITDGVIAVMCANGIADHTTDVYVVPASTDDVTPVELTFDDDNLETFHPDKEYLGDVTGVRVEDGALIVDMLWMFTNDALCCSTTTATGTYRFDGIGFDRVAVDVLSDKTRTERLATALNTGDRATVNTLMAPEWQNVFEDDVAAGATFTPGDCAITDSLSEYRWCDLTSSVQQYPYLLYWEGGPDEPGRIGTRRAFIEIVES